MVGMMSRQRELLKKFKESEKFSNHVGLRKSNIYFKISMYRFSSEFKEGLIYMSEMDRFTSFCTIFVQEDNCNFC